MSVYIAQMRPGRNANWTTVKSRTYRIGGDTIDAAADLNDELQRHGFRFSELYLHRSDLSSGHVLTADDGYEFRVINAEDAPAYPRNAAGRVLAFEIADETVEMAKKIQLQYDTGVIPWGVYNDLNIALDHFNEAVLKVADLSMRVVYKDDDVRLDRSL